MRASALAVCSVAVVPLIAAAGLLAGRATLAPYLAVLACAGGPLLLMAMRHRLQIVPLSPPWIVTLGLSTVGVLGFFLQSDLNGRQGGSLTFTLSASDTALTTTLFAASSASVACGAILTARVLGTEQQRSDAIQLRLSDRGLAWILIACFVPAVIEVSSTGVQLLDRPAHLTEVEGTSLVSVFGGLGIAAAGACGYAFSQTRGLRRLLALLAAVVYMTIAFASSSRGLALIPVVFAVGVFAARRDRRGLVLLVLAGTAAVLLLPLPLYLRQLNSHGLWPYLAQLDSFSYGNVDWFESAQNVLIAFPLAGTVAFYVGSLPLSFLVVALNPLPGTLAGWYNVSRYVRFDEATPYSAVGEIGNYGWLSVLLVWGALGVVMAVLDRRIGYYASIRRPLIGVALATLSGLILVFSLQYNLRSCARLVMYAVALEIAMRVFASVMARLRSRDPADVAQPLPAATQQGSGEHLLPASVPVRERAREVGPTREVLR